MDPLRKRFFVNGEPVAGSTLHAQYLKPANTLLNAVKKRMQLGNLSQLAQRYVTADGATLTAISRFEQDEIRIDVPFKQGVSVLRPVAPELRWKPEAQEYEQPRFLVATGPHGHIYQLDARSLRLSPALAAFDGCPGYIAATTGAIAIADNFADYYTYGSQYWLDGFAAQTLTHPKLKFYGRDWAEKTHHIPYTVYAETWSTTSEFRGLDATPAEFRALYQITRFWGFTVGGGDVDYYYDRFDSNGARQSHFDSVDWYGHALCVSGGNTYAALEPNLYDVPSNTYLPTERHFASMTPAGPESTVPCVDIDSLAAMDGRLYGLYISDEITSECRLARFSPTGVIEQSVALPASIYWIDGERPGPREGTFHYGRITAGAGRIILSGKTDRNVFVLYVFDAALNPVAEVPVPGATGFLPEELNNGWNPYVLEGDFTVAIGFDPYWIPKHTFGESLTPDLS